MENNTICRYIDAEVLKQQDFQDFSNTDVMCAIDNCPTADVQPIIHAKVLSFIDRHDSLASLYTCSNCDMAVAILPNYNYCEKCGAKLTRSTKSRCKPKGLEEIK